jgi:hypothetical protein
MEEAERRERQRRNVLGNGRSRVEESKIRNAVENGRSRAGRGRE